MLLQLANTSSLICLPFASTASLHPAVFFPSPLFSFSRPPPVSFLQSKGQTTRTIFYRGLPLICGFLSPSHCFSAGAVIGAPLSRDANAEKLLAAQLLLPRLERPLFSLPYNAAPLLTFHNSYQGTSETQLSGVVVLSQVESERNPEGGLFHVSCH